MAVYHVRGIRRPKTKKNYFYCDRIEVLIFVCSLIEKKSPQLCCDWVNSRQEKVIIPYTLFIINISLIDSSSYRKPRSSAAIGSFTRCAQNFRYLLITLNYSLSCTLTTVFQ